MEENRKLQETMTEEDVQKVLDFVRENAPKQEPTNDVVVPGEERLVNVSINPDTGTTMITDTKPVEESNKSFEDIMKDSDLVFDDSNITLEELSTFIQNAKEDNSLEAQLKEQELTQEDLEALLLLVVRFQNKEKIESPYQKMPANVKNMINKSLGLGSLRGETVVYNSNLNSARNTFAEMLLEEFVSSIMIERTTKNVGSSIEKIFDKTNADIGDTIVGYTKERNAKYREYINNNLEGENKEEALSIIDAIDHSYELTEFKEYCKHCKIRKIDVEKPTKEHCKPMDLIMDKYKDEPKHNIYNIYNTQTVLTRHLPEYNDTQIRAFFIAFSQYCRSFNPKVPKEHIAMFYTLYNILLLDVNKGENKDISDTYLNNIKECIQNLINRNNFLSI